jgi:hypothetical protein
MFKERARVGGLAVLASAMLMACVVMIISSSQVVEFDLQHLLIRSSVHRGGLCFHLSALTSSRKYSLARLILLSLFFPAEQSLGCSRHQRKHGLAKGFHFSNSEYSQNIILTPLHFCQYKEQTGSVTAKSTVSGTGSGYADIWFGKFTRH